MQLGWATGTRNRRGVEKAPVGFHRCRSIRSMAARIPVPTALLGHAFTTRTGREYGLGRRRLEGVDLDRPLHGVRAVRAEPTLTVQCQAVAAILGERPFAFSHLSAVRLLQLPAPNRWAPNEPVCVTRPTGCTRLTRRGVQDYAGLERRTVVCCSSYPVTAPATTWADLANVTDMIYLVVLGDAIAHAAGGVAELAAEVDRRAGCRGVRALRQALPLIRPASASPMESRCRLLFIAAGLPEPELNAPVTVGGVVLGRPDFTWRAQRVAVEYEGDHHRVDRDQWHYDISRERCFSDAGWRYVRVTHRALVDASEQASLLGYLRRLLLVPPG